MRKNQKQWQLWRGLKPLKGKTNRFAYSLIGEEWYAKQKTDRKAQITSDKLLLAKITREMAQPRNTQSAQTKTDMQINPKDGGHA
jgi:hypothetical protein